MAFLDPTANFARTTLSVGITSIATTMTLTSGTPFPDPDVAAYNVIIYNETDYPAVYNDPNVEIVRVTSETAGVYTITRGQEGTSASAHNTVGKTYGVILAPTDKTMDDIEAYLQGKAAADLASATTTDIGAVKGTYVKITGTTTITGLGSATGGTTRIVTFGGILTLTHNVTAIVLPTAANITTAAGDRAIFVSESPGVWLCVSYQRYDGTALATSGGGSFYTQLSKTTLGASAQTLSCSSFSAKENLTVIAKLKITGTVTELAMTFNSDTGSNYSDARFVNGSTAGPANAVSNITIADFPVANTTIFMTMRIMNITGFRKMVYIDYVEGTTSMGQRGQYLGIWHNTSSQITTITLDTGSSTNKMDTGSILQVVGAD